MSSPRSLPQASDEGPSPPSESPPPDAIAAAANRWIVAISVVFGALMSVMDVSVVNVALPHMMGSFGRTLSEITWVATSYSIAEIIMATMAGWWSTLVGRKRLYIASFIIFTIGSVLSGTSQTFTQMLIYRTLQGVGGGSLIPVSLAILRETFPPEEQGMAMSIYGMGVVLAPAIGPVLGGWLTDKYGWPWIFYINIPFSIVGILMVSVFLEDPHYLPRGVRRVDWGGIALLTVGLTGMQIVLERGQEEDWFASNWIVAATILTVLSLTILVFWELRRSEPVVNFRLLRNLPLSAGSGIGILFGIALYGSTFVLPALLQTLLGYNAYDAGITLLPRALTLFAMMPLVGWVYNYIDARLLIALGIGFIYWSFQGLAHLSTNVAFWNLTPILVLMGMGMSFQFVTLTTLSVSTVAREEMTSASSIYTLSRRVGGNIGYALLATIVARRSQFHRVHLVTRLIPTNPVFVTAHAQMATLLALRGVPPAVAPETATGLLDQLVNQQAGIMAYNDAAWLVGIVFLATLPLLFLFPGRAPSGSESTEGTARAPGVAH
jgi:MFS transporter, DHA2 family, multidrug resistance protein